MGGRMELLLDRISYASKNLKRSNFAKSAGASSLKKFAQILFLLVGIDHPSHHSPKVCLSIWYFLFSSLQKFTLNPFSKFIRSFHCCEIKILKINSQKMIWGGYILGEENEDEEEEAEEIEEESKKPEPQPIIKPSATTAKSVSQNNAKPPTSTQKPMPASSANSGDGIRRSSATVGQQNKSTTSSTLASMSSTQRRSSTIPTSTASSQSSQMKASSTPISNSVQSPPPPVEKRRFEGKVAIVTESNCGIDRAAAILLGKEGAKVTVHGTDEDELRRTIIRMMRADIDQDDILIVQGPIEQEQTLKNLVERTLKKFGKIDILINNAGKITHSSNSNNHLEFRNGGGEEEEDEDSVSSGKGGKSRLDKYTRRKSNLHRNSMWQMEDSHNFDLLFNINLKSITNLTRLCLPHLEDTKGAVVNVTSFGSQQAFSDYANYSTAKTALDNYCRSIAIKCAKRNIRVNNVNPGFITSETADDTEVHVNKFYLNWIKNHVPMGRGGTAEEVAKVIGFLASDDSSYITGATIVCDGAVSIFSKPSDFF